MASEAKTAADAVEAEDGAEAAAPAPASGRLGGILARLKGMSRKQMLMLGGAAVLVAGLGYGGMMFLGGSDPQQAGSSILYHDLPEMVVNLAATHERPQFLRVRVTLEIDDPMVMQALQPALPRVIDAFQVHLRELRAVDLDGSAGMFRLREELNRRINHAIAPAQVRAVLFREIVVQ
jgi:flagellar FliL protein